MYIRLDANIYSRHAGTVGMTERGAPSYAEAMGGGTREERAALIALLRARPAGLSWAEITTEVLASGSTQEVWHRLVPPMLPSPEGADPLETAARDLGLWEEAGSSLVTILDDDYPVRLRGIHQAPPILFARGTLEREDCAVSVVGSRKATDRGLSIAAGVAHALASRGITVIAGLALGIDTAVHRAALADGARTVAVIGTGINKSYPAENRSLQEEIASRGLLLSQFWPDAPPQKQNFIMRNATMSGYGLATVVVEAGEHSGARAQARMAVEHGRPVILTDLVVQRNSWAQALVGRPGIHVTSSLAAVLEVIDELIAERDAVGDELRRLVST
jgi:DNA processing protein